MNDSIREGPLTKEQEQLVLEGFKRYEKCELGAENTIRQYTFLIEDSRYKTNYAGSLEARLSFGNFHIVRVFVREEMRKAGIATALIRHAISKAQIGSGKFRQY